MNKYEPHLTKAQVPRHWFIHEETLVKQLVNNWKLVWPEDLVSGCWDILVLHKIPKINKRLMFSECRRTLDFKPTHRILLLSILSLMRTEGGSIHTPFRDMNHLRKDSKLVNVMQRPQKTAHCTTFNRVVVNTALPL